MKNILKITTIILIMSLLLGACTKFLDQEPTNKVSTEQAITNTQDMINATLGIYSAMLSTSYYGKALPVINDIAADIVTKKYQTPSNNHFDSYESWSITDNSAEIGSLWLAGYAIIDRAQRAIVAGKKILNSGSVSNEDVKKINACIGQCYGAKALALFNLVNFFALPYDRATAATANSGVPNVGDNPVLLTDKIERATIETNYNQILGDLEKAKGAWAVALESSSGNPPVSITSIIQDEGLIMNQVAVWAVEARVRLYMKDYEGAKTAANKVISLKGRKAITSNITTYKEMWSSTRPNSEDIFTLGITTAESQGTTSIGHLYGPVGSTYGARLSPQAYAKFTNSSDIRLSAVERDLTLKSGDTCYRVAKYNGQLSGTVSNVPVLRLPEIYLIIAECENELENPEHARNYLYSELVSKRVSGISLSSIPSDQEGLRQFIKDERVRELMLEGHRLFDMRRNGDLLSKDRTNSTVEFKDFDVSKFAFPIPLWEINVTKLPQNDWNNNLPQFE